MPSFQSALSGDPTRLQAVNSLVARLLAAPPPTPASFRQAASSIRDEAECPPDFWRALADYFLNDGHAKSDMDLQDGLAVLFRQWQLRGSLDPNRKPKYGRLISKAVFVQMLAAHWPRTAVEAELIQLPLKSVAECRATMNSVELGRYGLMWSTFCETHTDCDPFDPRTPEFDLVDALGLQFIDNEPFFLFVYAVPNAIEIRIPTISDAYGGNLYFPYRPGGRTFPIRQADRLSGRPERVHKAITAQNLLESVGFVVPSMANPGP